MTKYKQLFVTLAFAFLAFCSGAVLAEDQLCQFDTPNKKLEIAGCQSEGGVVVLKLIPSALSPYATDLEKLPTFIVSGKGREDVMKKVGLSVDATSPYSRLIVLPYPEAIVEFSDAPKSARLKVTQKGWKLLDMKSVVYSGAGGGEGLCWYAVHLRRSREKALLSCLSAIAFMSLI
ncbi:hypothetical protein [Pseudomonas chlororaphis]